jgi:hypothetical protein
MGRNVALPHDVLPKGYAADRVGQCEDRALIRFV